MHVVDGTPRELFVHRKGATRAFGPGHESLPRPLRSVGQPVLIGGSMGTSSYILVGKATSEAKAFSSACHGAGRALSRHEALRRWSGRKIVDDLATNGIEIKDRRTKPNDPVITRYVASLFAAVGTDAIVTLEVHNPAAFENAFHCRTVALTAAPLFVGYVRALNDERHCVVSPDPGGVKRAELFREALEAALGRPIGKGFADKHRSAGIVSGDLFVGDVAGATVLIIDDLISTGNTLLRAAQAARRAGAKRVIALVTHGLFMPGSAEVVADPAIDRFVITDAVPAFRLGREAQHVKIDMIPAGPLLAETIRRLHMEDSLTDLLVP